MSEIQSIAQNNYILSTDKEISHDNTLSGNGTVDSPLGLNETVIWTVPNGSENTNNYNITLLETIQNFEEIAVYCKSTRIENSLQVTTKNVYPVCDSGYTMFADGISTNHWNITEEQNGHYTCGIDVRLIGNSGYVGENYRWGVQNGTLKWEIQRISNNNKIYPHPYKIVGINRIANN